MPARIKITQVSSKVAIVIPEIGFEEEPSKPTILEDTVTKKKPKTTIRKAAPIEVARLEKIEVLSTSVIRRIRMAEPIKIVLIGRSCWVLISSAASLPFPSAEKPALKLERIMGIDLISEKIPAKATPPAPI
jgi:hypothetical protein